MSYPNRHADLSHANAQKPKHRVEQEKQNRTHTNGCYMMHISISGLITLHHHLDRVGVGDLLCVLRHFPPLLRGEWSKEGGEYTVTLLLWAREGSAAQRCDVLCKNRWGKLRGGALRRRGMHETFTLRKPTNRVQSPCEFLHRHCLVQYLYRNPSYFHPTGLIAYHQRITLGLWSGLFVK